MRGGPTRVPPGGRLQHVLKPGSRILLASLGGYCKGEKGDSPGVESTNSAQHRQSAPVAASPASTSEMEVEIPADPAAEAVGTVNDIIDEVGCAQPARHAPPASHQTVERNPHPLVERASCAT